MKETTTSGGPAYENWKAAFSHPRSADAREFPLFTDAWILGCAPDCLGPYALFNTVVVPRHTDAAARLLLRVDYYPATVVIQELTPKEPAGFYHGGWIEDEIAALLSLCLGIRLKAGGCTREFAAGGDPRGMPVAAGAYEVPQLLRSGHGMAVIPNAGAEHQLSDVRQLAQFPLVSPEDSVALVRAARLYQDALWVAESEPQLSWVLFVSAIEVAAYHWRSQPGTPTERLAAAYPDLEKLLVPVGGSILVENVAKILNPDAKGATKKFIDFVIEFMPPTPEDRTSHETFLIPWDPKYLKESMGIIYAWRSQALHGGTPFPPPMCARPVSRGAARAADGRVKYWSDGSEKQTFEERHPGGCSRGLGGVWNSKHTPMLLHVFEYIVRGALLRWWDSMVSLATLPSAEDSG